MKLSSDFGTETSAGANNEKGTSTKFSHERNRARKTCALAQKSSADNYLGSGRREELQLLGKEIRYNGWRPA